MATNDTIIVTGGAQERSGFGIVHRDLLADHRVRGLSRGALYIWVLLRTYTSGNEGARWRVSTGKLASISGYSRASVFRSLKELREVSLIRVDSNGRCNVYTVSSCPFELDGHLSAIEQPEGAEVSA